MTGHRRVASRLAVAMVASLLGGCAPAPSPSEASPVAITVRVAEPDRQRELHGDRQSDADSEPDSRAHTGPLDRPVPGDCLTIGFDRLPVHGHGLRGLCHRKGPRQYHLRRSDLDAAQSHLHQE